MSLKERKLKTCGLPSHTIQGSDKEVLVQLVLVSQDGALFKGHRHGRPVLGTFATGETNTI